MNAPLLVADLFCGAGGSSTGARRALEARGLTMRLVAVNHWPIAVETHQRNHPDAQHYCVDVYKTRPRDAIPGGRLDLLMASPTCTFHSRARGGKPISRDQKRGRMTPTQVVRWCTELDVRVLLVENVPEFVEWGPVHGEHAPTLPRCLAAGCRERRPCRWRKGVYFRPWVRRLERLGFVIEHRVLNAADHGDATTRRRFFLLGRRDGVPIRWPAPTHSRTGGALPRWRAARAVIDWKLRGRSIFGRKKPLSAKTLMRIYAGAVKFRWPEPFLVILRQHMTAQSIDGPLPAICAAGNHIGVAQPVARPPAQGTFVFGNRENNVARDPDAEPLPGMTTAHGGGIAVATPIVTPYYGPSKNGKPRASRGVDEPLATQGTENRFGLAEPVIAPYYGQSKPQSVDAPVLSLSGCNHMGLAEPVVLRTNMHKSNAACVRSADRDPLPTITTDGGLGVAEPFILSQGAGGAPRSVADPVPTIPTEGAHSFVAPYYGTATCRSVEDPLPTQGTKDRFGLVIPVTHEDASMRARSLEDPLPAVTGAPRGELAVIVASHGERPGQTPRFHSVDEPAPAICATGRVDLAQGVTRESPPEYDILFRMLEPHELAAAMGFSDEETSYEFVGNKTEVTRQIGNACPVHQIEALIGAQFEPAAKEALVA